MTPEERKALKDAIDAFKQPGDSTLDAALNLIDHHARDIRRLNDEMEYLRRVISQIREQTDRSLKTREETP